MKQQKFKLCKNNNENREKVIEYVSGLLPTLPKDENQQIVIRNYNSSKSAKQRRLDWKWNSEIARSGLGRSDDKEEIHLDCKWMFAKPLLLAGEDDYSLWIQDMWEMILNKYPHDASKQRAFFVYAVHTEKMDIPMVSEYLKGKQLYWTGKGVNLTDPSLAGL